MSHTPIDKATSRTTGRHRLSMAQKEVLVGLLLLAPGILALCVVIAWPMIEGIRLSFTDTNIIRGFNVRNFVGLDNYVAFFRDPKFGHYLQVTGIWLIGGLIGSSVLGLLLALLLNREMPLRFLWRSIALFPWVMPMVVVGMTWKWILDGQWGILNYLLTSLGITHQNILWMADPRWIWPSILLVKTWKSFPFWYVTLLSGLQVIPQEMYEAGKMDGTNPFTAFWYITLPQLRPVITILFLLDTVWTVNDFASIWVLTRGGPADLTMTLSPLVYVTSFDFYRLGQGSAIAVLMMIVMMIFSVTYIRLVRFDI